MKITYILSAALIALALTGCENLKWDKDKDKDKHEIVPDYTTQFSDRYGTLRTDNDWCQAVHNTMYVDPGDNDRIKVYALQRRKYHLVADIENVSEPSYVSYDAVETNDNVILEIGGKYYQSYRNEGISTTRSKPITPEIELSDEPYSWVLLLESNWEGEDKHIKSDFDFNDAVIRISNVNKGNAVQLTIAPRALGHYCAIYMHYNDGVNDDLVWPDDIDGISDCELHQWLGFKTVMTRVNVGPVYESDGVEMVYNEDGSYASGTTHSDNYKTCVMNLPPDFTMSQIGYPIKSYSNQVSEIMGIYFTLGTFKSYTSLLARKEADKYDCYTSPQRFEAPHIIVIADDNYLGNHWRWPNEKMKIDVAYTMFSDWVLDHTDIELLRWSMDVPASLSYVY